MGVESQIGLGAGRRNDELHHAKLNFTEQCNLSALQCNPCPLLCSSCAATQARICRGNLDTQQFCPVSSTCATDHPRVVA